ncbi:MAG: histidinol-phosphate aminotransferase [Ilumatobacteraceae bacterium]|nr:histidinol-phosphate aminotransferase [Ilumatobacteraceae bacterium]
MTATHSVGRPRPAVDLMAAYRPGKGAAQAEAEHGITNAIKLASNENPLPPIRSIVEAVAAAATGANRYADHRATAVRQRLSTWLDVPVESVTVGAGSVGLLQQLFLTYVDPGDEVVYPWRSFEVYPVYTQLMAGTAVTTSLNAAHAFDLDAVAAAVSDRTKLVLLATPNNPTGTALSTDDMARLIAGISPATIVVIDEAYREFLDPALGNPVRDLVPRFPNVVVTRTFSKAQGLAGIRVGYAIGDPEVITAIDKTLFPFAVNAIAQAAAIAAIDAADEIAQRVSDILSERARVIETLTAAGWRLPDAQANFVYLPIGQRTDEIYLGLERRGVVTRPFSNEGIRVTISTPAENDRFLQTLAEVVAPSPVN